MKIIKPNGYKENAVACCNYIVHIGDLCWDMLRDNRCIEKRCRHLEILSECLKSSINMIRDSRIKKAE